MLLKDFCELIPVTAELRLRIFKNNRFQEETMIIRQEEIDPIYLSKEIDFIKQEYFIQTLTNNLIQVNQYYLITINI